MNIFKANKIAHDDFNDGSLNTESFYHGLIDLILLYTEADFKWELNPENFFVITTKIVAKFVSYLQHLSFLFFKFC